MVRSTICTLALALMSLGLLAPHAAAEEAKKEKARAPQMASDEEVAKALEEYKAAYKAKGLRGDDRTMQREYAMRLIKDLHHPEVVDALGKATRASNVDEALYAMSYLGDQVLLPHESAKHLLKAMKRHKKDLVVQMTGLQQLGRLKYLGASNELRAMLKHREFIVRKAAISAVGDIGDIRMLPEVLKVLGVKIETDSKGNVKAEGAAGKDPDKKESKKETVEEGYSWEGAEAVVDRGEADNTQENADAKKQAEAQIAKNKAEAAAAAGKGGGSSLGSAGGSVGGMGGSKGRGGSSRSTDEMIPAILRTLKKLTGEEFRKPSAIRAWLGQQKQWLETEQKRLDKLEKAQKAGE